MLVRETFSAWREAQIEENSKIEEQHVIRFLAMPCYAFCPLEVQRALGEDRHWADAGHGARACAAGAGIAFSSLARKPQGPL